MNKDLFFNGEKFISAKRAALLTGYASDHVASLAREGKVLGKLVGRTWYVSQRSILSYKKGTPLPVPKNVSIALSPEPQPATSKDLYFEGERYISSVDAAKLVGYAPDHVASLARKGAVTARMMGRTWYVSRAGILAHKKGARANLSQPKPRAKRAPRLAVLATKPGASLLPARTTPTPKPVAYISEPVKQALPMTRPVAPKQSSVFDSTFNRMVIGLVSLFVIAGSLSQVLGFVSPELGQSFEARLADAGTASVLGSLLDRFQGLAPAAVRPNTKAAINAGSGRANGLSVEGILAGEPATVPAGLALKKLEKQLEAQIDAYAKSKLAAEVSAAAPRVSQAPVTVVFNQTAFKSEILDAVNSHVSAQSNSDTDYLSQGLRGIATNGMLTSPTLKGGSITGAAIANSSFSGGSITLGLTDTATLPNLAFTLATGTSATTTNLFSANGVFGALTAGSLSVDQNTFNVNSGLTLVQKTNGTTQVSARRATDTVPAGDFIVYTNAAGDTPLFRVDNSGNIFAGGITNSGAFTVTSLSEPQLRVQYDANDEITVDVASNGTATYGAIGTTPRIIWRPSANRTDTFQFQDKDGNAVLSLDTTSKIATLSNLLVSGSSTLQNFTFVNATGTSATTTNLYSAALTAGNATTTNLFSSTASSTNLFSTNATLGTLAAGPITSGLVNGQTISSAANFTGTLTATGGLTTLSNLLLTGSTTLQNFTFQNATGTAATTTNFFTTNLVGTSALLTGATTTSLFSTTASSTNLFTSAFNADNGTLFVDNTNHRVGVGTTLPGVPLDVVGAIRTSDGGTGRLVTSITSNAGSLRAIGSVSDTLDLGGASYLTLSTYASGWQERVRVTNGGNVGIGTTNPQQKLVAVGNILAATNAGDTGGAPGDISLVSNGGSPIGSRLTYGTDGTGWKFAISKNTAGTVSDQLVVQDNGNVGIGATNPGTKLQINGDLRAGNGTSFAGITPVSSAYEFYAQDAAGNTQVLLNPVGNSYLNGGNVGIGTTTPLSSLSVANTTSGNAVNIGTYNAALNGIWLNGGYGLNGTDYNLVSGAGQDLFINRPTGKNIHVRENNGTDQVTIASGGNVGIGTTNPGQKLEVAGKIFSASSAGSGNGVIIDATAITSGYSTTLGEDDTGSYLYGNSVSRKLSLGVNSSRSNLVIDTSGNVGIGTTNPQGKLHIAAPTGTASPGSIALAIRDSGSPTYGFDLDLEGVSTGDLSLMRTVAGTQSQVMTFQRATGNVGIGVTNPQAKLQVHDGTNNNIWMRTGGAGLETQIIAVKDDNSTYQNLALDGAKLILNGQTGGNVGIGTTNPQASLHVGSGGRASGAGQLVEFHSGTDQNLLFTSPSVYTNGMRIFAQNDAGNTAVPIEIWASAVDFSNGNVGIGVTNPDSTLPAHSLQSTAVLYSSNSGGNQIGLNSAGANYGMISNQGTGIWSLGYGSSLSTLATPVLNWNSSGNVGIGTTNPGAPIDVEKTDAGSGNATLSAIFGRIGATPTATAREAGVAFSDANNQTLTAGITGIRENSVGNYLGGMGFYVHSTSGTPASAFSDLTRAVTILDGGNVGIGNTNPDVKLTVSDNGGSDAIRIRTSYAADYAQHGALTWSDATNVTGQIDTRYNGSSVDMAFGHLYNGGYTSNTLMTLRGNGNLGIGVTNPSYALDVTSATQGLSRVYIHPQTGTDYSLLQFSNTGGTSYVGMDNNGGNGLGSGTAYAFTIYTPTDQVFSPGGTEKVRFTTSGKVGIGITNPGYPLQVNGTIYATASDLIGSGRQIYGNDDPTNYTIGDNGSGVLNINWYSGIRLSDSAGEVMRVSGTNVGIGITNPSSKLTVGAVNGQTGALVSARGPATGNAFEFGHANAAGYASTIGNEVSSGAPFIAFNSEAGTSANTYRTRGLQGTVIRGDLAGGLNILNIPNASADNQAGSSIFSVSSAGSVSTAGNINLNAAGGIYQINGSNRLSDITNGAYTALYRGSSNTIGIYLGNTDASNYYDNSVHYFRTAGGATTVATLNATGLSLGNSSNAATARLDVYGSTWNNTIRAVSTGTGVGTDYFTNTSSRTGVVYGDGSAFGLLNGSADWAVRAVGTPGAANTQVQLYTNNVNKWLLASGGYTQQYGEIYPGNPNQSAMQGSYYLAGNYGSFGLYTNTSFRAAATIRTDGELDISGGPIVRLFPSTGYLSGNYTTGETSGTTGAIYTIGGSYVPSSTSLGLMYGIGYTVNNNGQTGLAVTGAPAQWGMYVASNGTASIFLDSDNGSIYANGSLSLNGFKVTSPGSSYGTLALNTASGGYYGLLMGPNSSFANLMYDGSGNGGIYYEASGLWEQYFTKGTSHLNIMTSTDLGYTLGVSGSIGSTGTMNFTGSISGNGTVVASTGDSYLRINESNQFSSGVWLGTSDLKMYTSTLRIGSSGGAGEIEISGTSGDSTKRIQINGNSGGITYFNAGNVGIGVTNPSTLLDLSGTVGAHNTVVTSGNAPSASGGCAGTSSTFVVLADNASVTTSMIFYNSAANGGHARITSVSTCTDGSSVVHTTLSLSDSVPGNTVFIPYVIYAPVGDLGSSSSEFFNNGYIIRLRAVNSTVTGGFDLAEQYQTTDQTLEDGDVVSIDPLLAEGVRKSAPGEVAPLGIISEHAPLTLGDNGPGWKKVALAGRVDAKVSDENGTIAPGDFLAPSASEAGKLAKAVRAGMVLGQALEAEHAGVVKIFTNRFFYDPAEATTTASTTSERVAALEVRVSSLESLVGTSTPSGLTLDATTSDALASGVWASASLALRQGIQSLGQVSVIHNALYAVSGIFDKVFAREVHTDLICVTDANGQTCVNRSQLDSMLAAGGQSGTVSGVQAPTAPAQTSTASSTPDATASSTPSTDTSTATSTPSTTDTASSTPSTSTTQTDTSASSTPTGSTVASAPSDTTSVTP